MFIMSLLPQLSCTSYFGLTYTERTVSQFIADSFQLPNAADFIVKEGFFTVASFNEQQSRRY